MLANPLENEDTDNDEEATWREEIREIQHCVKRENSDANVLNDELSDEEDIKDHVEVLRQLSTSLAGAHPSPSNVILTNQIIIVILKQMESAVLKKLRQNAIAQDVVHNQIKECSQQAISPQPYLGSFVKCGMPFFRTVDGLSYSKACSGPKFWKPEIAEIHFGLSPCWSDADNKRLVNSVTKLWRENVLETHEKALHTKVKNGKLNQSQYEKALKEIKKEESDNKVNAELIDWWRVAALFQHEFSPNMCKAQWVHNCNPRICRGNWSKTEKKKLCELAETYSHHEWDLIAEKLRTNRSGLQCCITYMRHSHSIDYRKATLEDDIKLLRLFEACKQKSPRPRIRLAYYFDQFSHHQLRQRLKSLGAKKRLKEIIAFNEKVRDKSVATEAVDNLISKSRQVASHFSSEEDRMLLAAVNEIGEDWSTIMDSFPGRSLASLQNRYRRLQELSNDVLGLLSNTEGSQLVPQNPPNIWSVLNLMWEGPAPDKLTRYGIGVGPENITLPISQLCRHLENGHIHLFGPRFPIPRCVQDQEKLAASFAVAAHSLNVNYDIAEIVEKMNKLSVDNSLQVLREIKDVPVPKMIETWGSCLIPPNSLTLVGARTLLLSKGLLMGQSTFPIQFAATQFRASTPADERLPTQKAKQLLYQRVFSMFFLSFCLGRIPQKPINPENVKDVRPDSQLIAPKVPRFVRMKPKKKKIKKKMVELCRKRWQADRS